MSKTNVFQFKSPNKPPLWPLRWSLQTSLYFFSCNLLNFSFAGQQKPTNKNKTHSTLLVLPNPNQQNA